MSKRKWIPKEGFEKQYEHPLWQKKRLKIMQYARFRCQGCGAKDETLHVHHSYYVTGKKVWQYPDGSLICICRTCHGKLHGIMENQIQPPRVSPRTEEEQMEQFLRDHPDALPKNPEGHQKAAKNFGVIFDMLGKL